MFSLEVGKLTAQFVLLIILLSFVSGSRQLTRKTAADYLDVCLLGKNHKQKPGPESELYLQCTPWKSRSCCSEETSLNVMKDRNYLNFNWDHCKDLSLRCRQYFIQDLCFYECSPNVGPWLVEDKRKIRQERFQDVPLCKSDCDQWWDACKDDLTCVENWAEHFNWTSGINKCPVGSTCRPFHQVYTGAKHFCENLFGPSFKVVNDAPGECFYMWFDYKSPNPNEEVAKRKVKTLLGGNSSLNNKPLDLLCFWSLMISVMFVQL